MVIAKSPRTPDQDTKQFIMLMAESPKQAELMVIAKSPKQAVSSYTYGRQSRTSKLISSHQVMALAFYVGQV
jgi:hypothetical protein